MKFSLLTVSVIVLLSACKKDDTPQDDAPPIDQPIIALDQSSITENKASFVINNFSKFDSVKFTIAHDDQYQYIMDHSGQVAEQSVFELIALVSNAPHYIKAKGYKNGVASSYSETVYLELLPKLQKLTLSTSDGVDIAVEYAQPGWSTKGAFPSVVFIHQFGRNRSEWLNSKSFTSLLFSGYMAITYDIRNHGESANDGLNTDIFNDPDRTPKDLDAVLDFVRNLMITDNNRIGLIGSSIGCNLVAAASADEQRFKVNAVVGLSGRPSAAQNLSGNINPFQPKNAFWISSELEQGGARADFAQDFYNMSKGDRELEIVTGSNAHGTDIFNDDPTLESRIIDWIRQRV